MEKIKKGDIVGRISYGKDIVFYVERIFKLKDGTKIALLKGITERIEADSDVEDLYLMDKTKLEEELKMVDRKVDLRIAKNKNIKIKTKLKYDRIYSNSVSGKILHLDRRQEIQRKVT